MSAPKLTAAQHRALRKQADAQTAELDAIIGKALDAFDLGPDRRAIRATLDDWIELDANGDLQWNVSAKKARTELDAIGASAAAKLLATLQPLAKDLASAGLARVPDALTALAPVFGAEATDVVLDVSLPGRATDSILDDFDERTDAYGKAVSDELSLKIAGAVQAGWTVREAIGAMGGDLDDDADADDAADALADGIVDRATTRGETYIGDACAAAASFAFGMASADAATDENNDVQVMWLTEDGGNICEICQGLDGEIRDEGEDFDQAEGIAVPPDPHPNCRCEVVSVQGNWVRE